MDNRTQMFLMCENIKRIRKNHRLSKREMAAKLGISVDCLKKLENGYISDNIPCSIFDEIEKNFRIELKDLLTRLV